MDDDQLNDVTINNRIVSFLRLYNLFHSAECVLVDPAYGMYILVGTIHFSSQTCSSPRNTDSSRLRQSVLSPHDNSQLLI